MACSRPAAYVNHVSEYLISSAALGVSRTISLTSKTYLALPMDAAEVVVGMRIHSLDSGATMVLGWQHSLDAATFKPTTPITLITVNSTSVEDYVGNLTTTTQLLPFGRLVVTISHASTQVSGVISVWGLYKYR